MIIIAGLGNPGKEYSQTRHNTGFSVVEQLAREHNIEISRAKFRAHFGEGIIGGKKVMLFKPQTYMNLSGEAIRDALEYYKEPASSLIVVYDDIDLEPGEIRVRERGSAGSHNGMKNIIYQLESDELIRVRVGIGEKPSGYDLADYVLSRFKKDELEDMQFGIIRAAEAVELIVREGAGSAMDKYNARKSK